MDTAKRNSLQVGTSIPVSAFNLHRGSLCFALVCHSRISKANPTLRYVAVEAEAPFDSMQDSCRCVDVSSPRQVLSVATVMFRDKSEFLGLASCLFGSRMAQQCWRRLSEVLPSHLGLQRRLSISQEHSFHTAPSVPP